LCLGDGRASLVMWRDRSRGSGAQGLGERSRGIALPRLVARRRKVSG
jgi:hypothetical protein